MNDFTIIGAGIVGLATAYHLHQKHPEASITILEKEEREAFHQSGRNSGVIHSGIYYPPGSAKAINCIRGYSLLLEFCRKHHIKHEICGKLIVATNAMELPRLEKIYENGIANELNNLRLIDEEEIRKIEPAIHGVRAIHVPQSGIVNYTDVAAKLRQLLQESGVVFHFNNRVTDITDHSDYVRIKTSKEEFNTHHLICCAGLYADRMARLSGCDPGCRIVPFRGEYFKLQGEAKTMINNLIYPVPDPDFPFLGLHFTRRINGDVDAGPNAVLAFAREGYNLQDVNWKELKSILAYRGFQNLARRHFIKGIGEMRKSISQRAFVRELQKLMPIIKSNDLVKAPAGVRAQAVLPNGTMLQDFHILQQSNITHVINAPSPAATSSLAIGEHIASLV